MACSYRLEDGKHEISYHLIRSFDVSASLIPQQHLISEQQQLALFVKIVQRSH